MTRAIKGKCSEPGVNARPWIEPFRLHGNTPEGYPFCCEVGKRRVRMNSIAMGLDG